MNQALLKEIVAHIYAQFAIIPSDYINLQKTGSLLDPTYLLNDKITFESEGIPYYGKVWGCQMSMGLKEIKIILGDLTLDKEFPEFAMIVSPKDAPMYGLYLMYNTLSSEASDSHPMLAVSPDAGKGWLQCNVGLQATFLAAMEQARDLHAIWEKCTDHKIEYAALISFIKFHAGIYNL